MNRYARENVEYNSFAKTFSNSRKNMKWEEISYFISIIHPLTLSFKSKGKGIKSYNILDIGCGNGRLLGELKKSSLLGGVVEGGKYLGLDLSSGLLEEARKNHPGFDFKELNMLDLKKLFSPSPDKERGLGGEVLNLGWGAIFFIASFHHLKSIEDRLKVLKDTYDLLESGGIVFMTNWALDSELNKEKYKKSIIPPLLGGEGGRGGGIKSKNIFGSIDYNIKIGKFNRYYHCFSLEELEYLSKEVGFEIIENRLFENQKNYILILKKS